MTAGQDRSGEEESAGSGPGMREQGPSRFKLAFRDPDHESFWRLRDREATVEITNSEMIWTVDGATRVWELGLVRSIQIETRGVHDGADMFHATLTYADWRKAQFFSSRHGQPASPESVRAYREFLLILHERLAAIGATPKLTAGAAPSPMMTVVFVAACLLFVALPLVSLMAGRMIEGLGAAAAGAALVYPLYRTKMRNSPESYTLGDLPARMLP